MFSQQPFSYDTACIAAACANGRGGVDLIRSVRALGAPLAFEVLQDGSLVRWKVAATSEAVRLEGIAPTRIRQAFWRHRRRWDRDTIHRAKSIPEEAGARQLDFIDLGLLPAIGEEVSRKLDELLVGVVSLAKRHHEHRRGGKGLDYAGLFALIFRFLAAKVLGDRGHAGDWLADDAGQVIRDVEAFYFRSSEPSVPALRDKEIRDLVWERVRSAFRFENVSVLALADVYENTLVGDETRKVLGTHSTPPGIAEYLVRHLPFHEFSPDELHVLEPCAGHGVFLVAAMRRMRELLPWNMTTAKRHEYFVDHLVGIEIDPFACEVARLSLMLADYPNPDGWRLIRDDVFEGTALAAELPRARIVLCNPPFEAFTRKEQAAYKGKVQSTQKPAETLHRVLERGGPAMLGFVLPRTFLFGRSYRQFHSRLGSIYKHVDLVALPDRVFTHSDAESVLLAAHGKKTSPATPCTVRSSMVTEGDRRRFLASGDVTDGRCDAWSGALPSLWTCPLQSLWNRLSRLPVLGDLADIHQGVQFSLPLDSANRERLVTRTKRDGLVRGLDTVKGHLEEAFVIRGHVWINTSPHVMRRKAHLHPWSEPKAIVNASAISRGPWRLIAAPDRTGLVCYQLLHGIWPKEEWSVEAIAAVLNGPVANAYAQDHEGKRHNRIVTLKAIPMPRLSPAAMGSLHALVRDYTAIRARMDEPMVTNGLRRQLAEQLKRIDALVLSGYDLPPRLERKLLDHFAGYRRPVPLKFQRFFPAGFQPCIPYHEYVSPDFVRAGATGTLKRLQPIRDAAIHDAMQHLRRLDEDED